MPAHLPVAVMAISVLASPIALAAPDPLGAYKWKQRLLVVIAPEDGDPHLAEQGRLFSAHGPGNRDRDLVLVTAIGKTAQAEAIRGRFGVPEAEFRAILVGKDGGDKLSSATPIPPERLFGEIDAMPMRQNEMRRQAR